jgi:hypothetical protein
MVATLPNNLVLEHMEIAVRNPVEPRALGRRETARHQEFSALEYLCYRHDYLVTIGA